MADGDLASMTAGAQPSALLDYAVNPSPNGFDFGMSQPKTGLGYGLLGDIRSLANVQSCDDCAPADPCPNCATSDDNGGNDQAQVIKTQFEVPFPDFAPPPMATPAHPTQTPIIGDPHAPWNWGPDDWSDWFNGISQMQPTKAVERKCEDQVNAELERCEELAAKATEKVDEAAGVRERDSCKRHSWAKYAKCRRMNGYPDMLPYPDWYGDDD